MSYWWEIGIDKGEEGTETVGSFTELSSALYALSEIENETAFIDLWHDDGSSSSENVGMCLKKSNLNCIKPLPNYAR